MQAHRLQLGSGFLGDHLVDYSILSFLICANCKPFSLSALKTKEKLFPHIILYHQ